MLIARQYRIKLLCSIAPYYLIRSGMPRFSSLTLRVAVRPSAASAEDLPVAPCNVSTITGID